MGWANCGTDSQGRPIGYAHEAVCDHPECEHVIHRGLSYACGGMHGSDDQRSYCERYFCWEHVHFGEDDKARCLSCHKEHVRDEDSAAHHHA